MKFVSRTRWAWAFPQAGDSRPRSLWPPSSRDGNRRRYPLRPGTVHPLAALRCLIDIAVAIASTKIPLLLGTSPLPPHRSRRRWASGRCYMRSARMTPNCMLPLLAPLGAGRGRLTPCWHGGVGAPRAQERQESTKPQGIRVAGAKLPFNTLST